MGFSSQDYWSGLPFPSLQAFSYLFQRRQWHPILVLLPGNSHGWRSLVGSSPGVSKSQTRLRDFTFTFHFHALEKEMATHSSVLAWRIPGTGEPGGLPSMGSHGVGHDWSDLAAAAAAYIHIYTYMYVYIWTYMDMYALFAADQIIVSPKMSMS